MPLISIIRGLVRKSGRQAGLSPPHGTLLLPVHAGAGGHKRVLAGRIHLGRISFITAVPPCGSLVAARTGSRRTSLRSEMLILILAVICERKKGGTRSGR